MNAALTALERAFQMAQSGEYPTINDIVVGLRREGYASNQVEGPSLRKQLRDAIDKARDAKGT